MAILHLYPPADWEEKEFAENAHGVFKMSPQKVEAKTRADAHNKVMAIISSLAGAWKHFRNMTDGQIEYLSRLYALIFGMYHIKIRTGRYSGSPDTSPGGLRAM